MTDATQQRLLDAAEEVFAEKGFKAASIREISKKAGANVAAINYYFGDKERLYIAAVKYAHRGCTEGAPFPEWEPNTPPVQKLRDYIRVMATRMMAPQSPASLQLMMREMAQPTAACVEVVREYIQPMAQKLGGILTELLPPLTDRQRFLIAFSIVGQCLFYRTHSAIASLLVGEEEFRRYDVDLVANHVASFTLRALGLEDTSGKKVPKPSPQVQGVKS
jgi:TetR/AcrR family transcriptional regulator, regulator of cefoperazone and chloramphenicol sensitivity